jgi:hypothetical protein
MDDLPMKHTEKTFTARMDEENIWTPWGSPDQNDPNWVAKYNILRHPQSQICWLYIYIHVIIIYISLNHP